MKTISTNKPLTNEIESNNNGIIMEVLNTVETAILFYARKHPMIQNPYWWFAEKLGYKSKNQLYFIFQKREHYKLTYDTIKTVYKITEDDSIIDAVIKDLRGAK